MDLHKLITVILLSQLFNQSDTVLGQYNNDEILLLNITKVSDITNDAEHHRCAQHINNGISTTNEEFRLTLGIYLMMVLYLIFIIFGLLY